MILQYTQYNNTIHNNTIIQQHNTQHNTQHTQHTTYIYSSPQEENVPHAFLPLKEYININMSVPCCSM
ncbi:hypothetical protein EYC84_009032 [Monilinia fructicola]|uniref:Uncharacterized protein n=1 Tax=Monilinia fructicola TaxID=38448 RepID=A0A5M9JEX6_MONFR|nr:hypothetical protein EYC84_009032 [Monilinia fructicola]